MKLGKDKESRVEVRCVYCQKFLGEYFYQHAADTYSGEGGSISHGICLSCLVEHYPNESKNIKKALSKRTLYDQHPADGNPQNLEITSAPHMH